MDWAETLNRAIDYMEEHLTEDVSCETVAAHVYLSPFHFQRAFSLMTGMTVGEYVRKRRLSLAGTELAAGPEKRVVDMALKYGYETPESFCKAFRRFHGVSPQRAKRPGASLCTFHRLTVKIILEGGTKMEYRIENKPAFRVVLMTRKFTEETSMAGIPRFWDEYIAQGWMAKVCGQFGVCLQAENGAKEWEYGIGCRESLAREIPAGFTTLDIPAHTWAVFPCRGAMPDSLQQLWGRVYSEWLPHSGYELAQGCDLELYTEGDTSSPDYYSEIWLPVRGKGDAT